MIRWRWIIWLILVVAVHGMPLHAQTEWSHTHTLGKGQITGAAWHPDNEHFAIASQTGIRIYNLQLQEISHLIDTPVSRLRWNVDGTQLAAEDETGITIWNINGFDSDEIETVTTLRGGVAPFEWSPDGKSLAYAVPQGGIRVWDVATQRAPIVFDAHFHDKIEGVTNPNLLALAWSDDSKLIASVGKYSPLYIWEAATGKTVLTEADISLLRQWRKDASFLHWEGRQLWALESDRDGSKLNLIDLGDVVTRRVIRFPVEENWAFMQDQRLVYVDRYSQVFLMRNHDLIFEPVFDQHFSGEDRNWLSEDMIRIVFSPDEKYLLTATLAAVVLWRVEDDALIRLDMLTDYNGSLYSLAFSPDGTQLASGYGNISNRFDDSRLRVWDVATGRLNWRTEWNAEAFLSLDWHSSGDYIASGNFSIDFYDSPHVWDTRTHAVIGRYDAIGGWQSVYWQPNTNRLALILSETLVTWELETALDFEPFTPYKTSSDELMVVSAFSWSPDGQNAASDGYPSKEKKIVIWNFERGELLIELENSEIYTRGFNINNGTIVVFSPDGQSVAVAQGSLSGGFRRRDFSSSIAIYDAATGKRTQLLSGHPGGTTSLAWSPDSREIVSGGRDGTARAWDVTTGEAEVVYSQDNMIIPSVDWSSTGDTIAVGAQDGFIYLYQRG
jgi:WD40 repeat protein